jgi:GNAT superfamily N-acetyltransferase
LIKEIDIQEWKQFSVENKSSQSTDLFAFNYGCSRYSDDYFEKTRSLAVGFVNDDKIVAACVTQNVSDNFVILRGVFTLETERKKGHSTNLIKYAMTKWEAAGFKRMFGFCRSHLVDFYEKIGFTINHPDWPIRPCYEINNGRIIKIETNNHYFYKDLNV